MFIFITLYHLATQSLRKYCDLQTPPPLSCQRRISARWVQLQMIFFYYPADQTNYHPIPSYSQYLTMLSSDCFRRRSVTLWLFFFHLCFCRWSLIVIVLLLYLLCAGISLFLCDHLPTPSWPLRLFPKLNTSQLPVPRFYVMMKLNYCPGLGVDVPETICFIWLS